jgi:hypothetical protein
MRRSAASARRFRSKLRQLGARLFERERVSFGDDRRDQLFVEQVELGGPDRVLRLDEIGFILGADRRLVGALLVDLLDEIAVLGLPVVRRFDLRRAIELDEQIAGADDDAGLREVHDDDRTVAGAGEPRHGDDAAANRLDRAVEAKRQSRRLPCRRHGRESREDRHAHQDRLCHCLNHRR